MGPRDHSAQPRAELTRREDQALCCPGAAWPNEEAMASNCFIPTKMLRGTPPWVQANFSTNSQEGSPVLGQRAETTPLSAAQLLSQ